MLSGRGPGCWSCCLLVAALLAGVGCAQSAPVASADAIAQGTTDAATIDSTVGSESTVAAAGACCEESVVKTDVQQIARGLVVPEVTLVNQDGERLPFHSGLVQGKIVAINFIFTTCKGICPPMSANFAQLQNQLGDRVGDNVALISVSVDPTVDTPERLKAWREKFGGGPGWTLLTGDKQDVDRVLKEMEVFTADKNDHSPFILLGDEAAGKWTRVHGLTAPEKLAEMIVGMCDTSSAAAVSETAGDLPGGGEPGQVAGGGEVEPAELTAPQKYFTDVELVTQDGQTVRLYSDVLKGKVVVINSFFSTCKGSCPVMLSSFAKIQETFSDRLGKDLRLISITVDPENDTPEVLAAYAEQWHARPGWLFLTGEKPNVDTALYKIGHYVENKESHSNVFIIGNVATGLWKKARGLGKAEQLYPLIEEVLNDNHPSTSGPD